jgi:hypothetical protein
VTALVPASLLTMEDTVQIGVINGDSMGLSDGFAGYG